MPPITRVLKRSLIRCRIDARAVWRWAKRTYVQVHIWCLNLFCRIHGWVSIHAVGLLFAFLVAALTAILFFRPCIDRLVQQSDLVTPERVSTLQSLLLTVGGQLVGVSALVFALVTFALQANLTRMPFTLFARITSDRPLMGCFLGIFVFCLMIVGLALFTTQSNAGTITVLALWALSGILLLVFLSFQRALNLISPTFQLSHLLAGAQRGLRTWGKRARLFSFALPTRNDLRVQIDAQRLAFFQRHRGWTNEAEQALRHAAAYVRHYADVGDDEISSYAVTAMAKINAEYVSVKGRTFFANQLFFDTGLTTDPVLNVTLEQLRQLVAHGMQANNESLVENAMTGMAALVPIYNQVDYGRHVQVRTHANLAAGYLNDAIKVTLPKQMPDVAMHGVRLLDQAGQHFIAVGALTEAGSMAENISTIGGAGCIVEGYRPVTQQAMQALSNLTVVLLSARAHDPRFTFEKIAKSAELLTLAFLSLPGNQPFSIHSSYLGPYHSFSSPTGLPTLVTEIGNRVIQAAQGDANAAGLAHNLSLWSENLWRNQRVMFQAAITARSPLVVEIAHTTEHFAQVLLRVADAPVTSDDDETNLIRSANWLISTLSWVPDETEAVWFADNQQLPSVLIDYAVQVAFTDQERVQETATQLLAGWAFKAAKHSNQWRSPEKCFAAIAAILALRELDAIPQPLADIIRRARPTEEQLSNERIEEILQSMRAEYGNVQPGQFTLDRLEHLIGQVDRNRFVSLIDALSAVVRRDPPQNPPQAAA
jgi:hypothetical protein